MLAEAQLAISELTDKLYRLRDEREMFRLANDETLPPFVFEKKLHTLDARINELECDLASWEQWYEEILDAEVREQLNGDEATAPDPFEEIFGELSQVEGLPHHYYESVYEMG